MPTEIDLQDSLTAMEIAQGELNGELVDIIDVLSTKNEVLLDARWRQCNNGDYHKDIRWSTEPSGSEVDYNEGVSDESGMTEPVEEPTCMIESRSKVDARLLRKSPNKLVERYRRDQVFLRGMAKTFSSRLFFGDRGTYPKQINGILSRGDYSSLSSDYVHDNAGGNASATANKTCIVFIAWGLGGVELLYPRNDVQDTVVGIRSDDMGLQEVLDDNSKPYRAYVTYFESHFGIMIHDPRAIRVVVNISTTGIDGVDDFGFDENPIIDVIEAMAADGMENIVAYCNSTVRAMGRKRAVSRNHTMFSIGQDNLTGKSITMFDEVPLRIAQAITNTQGKIS